MADGSLAIQRLPAEALARLIAAERRQRRETIKRGLFAEPVSVEGLWLLQRGRCTCGCKEALDPLAVWDEQNPPDSFIVIAHVLARGSRGTHCINNVRLWRHVCNVRAAGPDTSGAASVKRHTPDMQRKLLAVSDDRVTRKPDAWQRKPDNYVSKLSKAYRRKVRALRSLSSPSHGDE